jgi:hypothetical protein
MVWYGSILPQEPIARPAPHEKRADRGVDRALWVEAMISITGSLKILCWSTAAICVRLQLSLRADEQPFWRGSLKRTALRLWQSAPYLNQGALFAMGRPYQA